MKNAMNMIAVVGLLMGTNSGFASEVGSKAAAQALKIVMKANPKVEVDVWNDETQDTGRKTMRLSSVIAENMTSYFDKKNEGVLNVTTNSCTAQKGTSVVKCSLVFNSSQRIIDKNGGYALPNNEEEFESALYIIYSVDLAKKVLVGKLESGRAG